MTDKYNNFRDLAAIETEGADFRIVAKEGRSGLLVVAPHAGRIEIHTSLIARAIAGDEHALYMFEGCKPHGNSALHVTSEHFDEPRCIDLVMRSSLAIGVHGAAGAGDFIIVGGNNNNAKRLVLEALRQFGATDIGKRHLLGNSPNNICNRTQDGGVQLEISLSLRNKLAGTDQRQVSALLTEFRDSIRRALLEYAQG